jgi:DNA polymerase-3 subunit alpha
MSVTDQQPHIERTTRGFAHLHVHGENSKQDSIARVKHLAKWVKSNNQYPALALTDHGNMGGAWKFYQACKSYGVKPIFGEEIYFSLTPPAAETDEYGSDMPGLAWDDPQVRFARTWRMEPDAESGKVKRNIYQHLTVLVKNETGWRNLCKIVNAAEDSFYRQPQIDYALLKKYGEGLIVLSGCLGGPVASRVAMARTENADGTVTWDEALLDEAREALAHLRECVPDDADGTPNVYVEIMEHGLGAEGLEHIKMLTRIADEGGVKIVATNDCHFMSECDCDAHDSWLVNGENARGNKVTKDDPNRWRFNGDGYWMRTEDEMRAIYSGKRWQEACDNTVELAERVDAKVLPVKDLRLPTYPVPAEVVTEWENGEEAVFTDNNGENRSARKVGKRAFPTPSDLYLFRLATTDHRFKVDAEHGGAQARYGAPVPAEARERMLFELSVIQTLGLSDYFLIVRDVIEWCRSDRGYPTAGFPDGEPGGKKRILVGPGRGSAAGSIVSYCVGIVNVDPLRNGLLFERFLDIDRVGMPDIDVDFESARRSEVYEYLVAKYDKISDGTDGYNDGERLHYVARIGAFQVAKTKRAIKDAARVLEQVDLGNKIAGFVPVHQGAPQSFAMLFEEPTDKDGLADENGKVKPNPEAQEFRDLYVDNADARAIIDLARAFEDVVAGEGIHAAGVIISDEPLNDLIPMRKDRKDDSGVPIALWDGKDIDKFGMLKLDALAIDNLDFLSYAVDNIALTKGITVDPDDMPDADDLSDPMVVRAYELLREGKTSGVFQMESSGLTELTVSAAPTQFSDISALLALYRPGPMGANMHTLFADRKNGRGGRIEDFYRIYTDDQAEADVIASVLSDTFATIVYQEQLMALAGAVAGFDALQRSDLRKAVSKKIATEIERLEGIFMEQGQRAMTLEDGSQKIAFRKRTLENLWTTFQASAAYLFNKSHTVAYGHLSYVTAYFKANYPVEYGAAVLAVSKKKADKRVAALQALAEEGIEVLGPDVNYSLSDTAPDIANPKAVRIGLTEIRDVGNNGVLIVKERERAGEFETLADLLGRVKTLDKDGNLTGKFPVTAVEGLIEAGALDQFGPRLGLMLTSRATTAEYNVPAPDAEWSELEKASRQRFRLGTSFGEHPLSAYKAELNNYRFGDEEIYGVRMGKKPVSLGKVAQMSRGDVITIGLLTQWTERTTRRGGKMANFTLEGATATMSGAVFDQTIKDLNRTGTVLHPGDIVAMSGYVKTREYTSVTTNDRGEETEETREVRELTGNSIEIVDVGAERVMNLPEVAKPINLRHRIHGARARAEQLAEDARAAKAAAAKKSTRKVVSRSEPSTTVEFTNEDLAAEPEPVINVDEPTRITLAEEGEWAVAFHIVNDLNASTPTVRGNSKAYNELALFNRDTPLELTSGRGKVFMTRGEGEYTDKCILFVQGRRNERTLVTNIVDHIRVDDDRWGPTSDEMRGWWVMDRAIFEEQIAVVAAPVPENELVSL